MPWIPVVIVGLVLVAIGGWLLVSGRSPGPDARATADGNVCPDGAEEWRPEGPSATFLVPIPGQRIQARCEPPIGAFQAYLDAWLDFDPGGQQTGTAAPGIPPSAFARTDLASWPRLFESINGGATHYEIDFTLPLQAVAVRCERRYRCERGQWVQQLITRALELKPVARPASFALSTAGVTVDRAARLAVEAVGAWTAAQQADLDRAGFEVSCG
ncbi:MAG TPA: hypothetical protein VGQ64_00375 [Candidatus Limnocylindrales bacterium]|nr:hypothetical protein [Candidatus Limnocylindrales bacterium]